MVVGDIRFGPVVGEGKEERLRIRILQPTFLTKLTFVDKKTKKVVKKGKCITIFGSQ